MCSISHFYPRSPCGERPTNHDQATKPHQISIHALLAESDVNSGTQSDPEKSISIHALLAESDLNINRTAKTVMKFLSTLSLRRATICQEPQGEFYAHFYPRSPCGERPLFLRSGPMTHPYFYPRSPCGERLPLRLVLVRRFYHFYPRSPCGERPANRTDPSAILDFYPRSPCGERPDLHAFHGHMHQISIHALLAESDLAMAIVYSGVVISIHALLAESDRGPRRSVHGPVYFYPRSPCGERRIASTPRAKSARHFYPRSPCGERHLR